MPGVSCSRTDSEMSWNEFISQLALIKHHSMRRINKKDNGNYKEEIHQSDDKDHE